MQAFEGSYSSVTSSCIICDEIGDIQIIWDHQRLLKIQGRIQKIFEGSSFGGEAHLPRSGLPRKRRSLGGSGGMAPENFLKYGCSEVQFGAFLNRNRIATGLTISQTIGVGRY